MTNATEAENNEKQAVAPDSIYAGHLDASYVGAVIALTVSDTLTVRDKVTSIIHNNHGTTAVAFESVTPTQQFGSHFEVAREAKAVIR